MNKSFVLSGGRKNDRFESGFKPATLPDWQNGNVTGVSAAKEPNGRAGYLYLQDLKPGAHLIRVTGGEK